MTSFAEVMSTNPPRLVIMFQRGEDGNERFQWGTVGAIPLLTLIGTIVRIQSDMLSRALETCEQVAFVLTWDGKTRTTRCFLHPDVPIDPLSGMLEVIKGALVGSRMAQHEAAQQVQHHQQTRVLGPDGTPMR